MIFRFNRIIIALFRHDAMLFADAAHAARITPLSTTPLRCSTPRAMRSSADFASDMLRAHACRPARR